MTLPKLAKRLRDNAISIVQIEANKSTRSFAEELKRELDKINYHCAIITRPAPVDKAKEIRIFDKSSDIKEHYLFKDQRKRTKEYNQFMQNIFSFKLTGKNKHDDAPDSMAQLEDMRNKGETGGVEISRRPF
jgi:predicted phage terminase large subunit-like protein